MAKGSQGLAAELASTLDTCEECDASRISLSDPGYMVSSICVISHS